MRRAAVQRSRRALVAAALVCGLSLLSCWKVNPDLKLSTNELDFGANRSEESFRVTNDSKDNALTSGVTPLDYDLKADRSWVTVSPASGHCDGEEAITHTVTIDRSGLADGENLATITATSNGGSDHITVRVMNGGGSVCTDPPGAPSDPLPADDATDVGVDVDLSWDGGESQCEGRTAAYDVYFGTVNPPPFHHNSGTKKTFNPGTLSGDTQYYWRIVAKDGNGSTSGGTWSFHTETVETSCTNPLTALALASPADNATGVSLDENLSWTGGESQCEGRTSTYDVYFGTDSSPQLAENVSGQSYNPGTLEPGTTYYWKVVASDGVSTRTSSTRQFTTAALACTDGPSALTSLSPAADATDVPLDPVLSWSGGDSQCAGLSATYDVYFGTSSPPPFHHNNGSDKSWDPGTLDGSQTYYWKIVAKDANGTQASAERKFTTACDDTDGTSLTAPCTPEPPNGKQKVNPKTSLTWGCGAVDCNLDVKFTVYLGRSSDLGEDDIVTTTSSHSIKPSELKGNTTYYWKVVAEAGTTTRSSPLWSFKTRD